MPRKEYAGLSLPKSLIAKVKAEVDAPQSSYATVTEFVKEAIREKLARKRGG